MVLNKDEFMNLIKEHVGEDNSDKSLKFLEDMTDTFNALEEKTKSNNKKTDEQWKAELEAKDKEWREKYKERFFNGGSKDDDNEDKLLLPEEPKPSPEETITIDDLFEEKGVK